MYSLMMFGSKRMRVALDKHRDAVVRVDHRHFLRLVEHIHVDDLEIHALFVEDDAATVAEGQVVPE